MHTPTKWMITIPPDGAARVVALQLVEAFTKTIPPEQIRTFDCLKYRRAFVSLLKKPDEAIITDLINHALIVQIFEFGASTILVPALSPITLFSLNILRRNAKKTIHWFFEDFRRAPYWKSVVGGYNGFAAIQESVVRETCESAGVTFAFIPTAASAPFFTTRWAPQRIRDISFVGIPSPYRITVLEKIADAGYRISIAGQGWNRYRGPLQNAILTGEWISPEDAANILASSKIGLNLSVDDPSAEREHTHVSPRVYDIAASGAALITEDVPLNCPTIDGFRFETFCSPDELLLLIDKTLRLPPDEQRNRQVINRTVVQENHCYEKRCQQFLSFTEALP